MILQTQNLCLLSPCYVLRAYCRQHTHSTAEGDLSGDFPVFSSTWHLGFCLSLQEPQDTGTCPVWIILVASYTYSTVSFVGIPLISEIKCICFFFLLSSVFNSYFRKWYACFIVYLFTWERQVSILLFWLSAFSRSEDVLYLYFTFLKGKKKKNLLRQARC